MIFFNLYTSSPLQLKIIRIKKREKEIKQLWKNCFQFLPYDVGTHSHGAVLLTFLGI